MTPSYLRDKLPLHRRPMYRLTNSNTFYEIGCRTSRYRNSFFPDVINSWNNIITHFQDVPTFIRLKTHIISLIRPKAKNIFGIHDPLGLRYLLQMRVKLSPLRSHKNHHNFADTPSEICECNLGIEDNHHFLFECIHYAALRATLAASVVVVLQRNNLNHLANQTELYLYGYPTLNFADNRQILLSTIKYITDTKRFPG